MPDRSKVRFQTKRVTEAYVARERWIGFRKRTSNGVIQKEELISLKKAKLESANWEGPDTEPTVCNDATGIVQTRYLPWTWHQGVIEGASGLFIQ